MQEYLRLPIDTLFLVNHIQTPLQLFSHGGQLYICTNRLLQMKMKAQQAKIKVLLSSWAIYKYNPLAGAAENQFSLEIRLMTSGTDPESLK